MQGAFQCNHFWSQIGTDGNIRCAWCGLVAPSPITWASDTTTTLPASKAQEESDG